MKVLKSASGLIILAMTTLFISNYWVRPLADDYCLGANVHTFGTLGAISNYFQTWSGDAALIIALVYLVGMPLTLIGTTGYAFLPFVLAFFAITSLIMFLLKGIVLNRIKSILAAILLFVLFIVAMQYSAVLDKGYFASNFVTPSYFNLAINSWSTIIVQYLFLPTICYLLFTYFIQETKSRFLISFFVALIIGTSGYSLSATFFVLFFLRSKFKRENFAFPIFLSAVSAASYFSKGARARNQTIMGEQNDLLNLSHLLDFSGRQLLRFLGLYLNSGILVTVMSAISLALILKISSDHSALLLDKFICLSYFVVVAFSVNALAEFFTYNAFWHLVFIKLIVFLQVVLGSLYLVSRWQKLLKKPLFSVIVLALLVCSGVAINLNEKIRNSSSWQKEVSIDSGIAERDSDWVKECWDILQS